MRPLALLLVAVAALGSPVRPFDSSVSGVHVHNRDTSVFYDPVKRIYLYPGGD